MAEVKEKEVAKVNPDNPIKLKCLKKAEVSPRVLSFNMASRAELAKNIRWSYREQRINIERMRKKQHILYKDLCRLQQNKRRMLREAYIYKQEELRLEMVRAQRDEYVQRILNEYDRKSQEVIDSMTVKRRKRKSSLEARVSSTDSHERRAEVDEPETEISQDEIECEIDANEVESEAVLKDETFENERIEGDLNETREEDEEILKNGYDTSRRSSSSKVVEVGVEEPKTSVRRKSEQESIVVSPNSTIPKLPPTSRVSMTSPDDNGDVIAEVKRVNESNRRRSERFSNFQLPPIEEGGAEDSAWSEKRKPANNVHRKHSDHADAEKLPQMPLGDESRQPASSVSVTSPIQNNKKMTNIEWMKDVEKRRDAEKRKILDLPYQAYTMDKNGRIVPMVTAPKPFHMEAPSNRDQYEKDKMLENQYSQNAMQKIKLKNFYAKLERPPESGNKKMSSL